MKGKMVSHGQCVGVANLVPPHKYFDGKKHLSTSYGLCPKCQKLTIEKFYENVTRMRLIEREEYPVSA